jgi:hypothetical protein
VAGGSWPPAGQFFIILPGASLTNIINAVRVANPTIGVLGAAVPGSPYRTWAAVRPTRTCTHPVGAGSLG